MLEADRMASRTGGKVRYTGHGLDLEVEARMADYVALGAIGLGAGGAGLLWWESVTTVGGLGLMAAGLAYFGVNYVRRIGSGNLEERGRAIRESIEKIRGARAEQQGLFRQLELQAALLEAGVEPADVVGYRQAEPRKERFAGRSPSGGGLVKIPRTQVKLKSGESVIVEISASRFKV